MSVTTDEMTDEMYEIADKLELAMETRPVGYGWTPSEVGRKAGIPTHKARPVLAWMVRNVYVTSDDRGAWSHYYRRH
jgi:hypothetical protein